MSCFSTLKIRRIPGVVVLICLLLQGSSLRAQSAQVSNDTRVNSSKEALETAKHYLTLRPARGLQKEAVVSVTGASAPQLITEQDDAASVQQVSHKYFESVIAPYLNLPGSATVTQSKAVKAGARWYSTFTISFGGIPVRGAYAKLVLGAVSGKPLEIRSAMPVAEPRLSKPVKSVGEVEMMAIIASRNGAVIRKEPTLVYVPNNREQTLTLAYETLVEEALPSHLWRYTYDAESGNLLERVELLEFEGEQTNDRPIPAKKKETINRSQTSVIQDSTVTPTNKVTSPLAGLNGKVMASIYPRSPLDVPITVPLYNIEVNANSKQSVTDAQGSFNLLGVQAPFWVTSAFKSPIFNVDRHDNAPNSTFELSSGNTSVDILWNDDNSHAAERNTFYHIYKILNHVIEQDPSFDSVNYLGVNVNIDDHCNAYYNPYEESVNFFAADSQCANSGLIADVIYHEFAHRVNHVHYSETMMGSMMDGSLNEAFADVTSALFIDDPIIGKDFRGKDKPLRNCDNKRSWPDSLYPEIHLNGEIITGAFWDLRKLIGREEADKLFHRLRFETPDGTNNITPEATRYAFTNVLTAALKVDDDDNDFSNGTPHMKEILEAFHKHNINLSDVLTLKVEPIKDQSSSTAYDPIYVNVTSDPLLEGHTPTVVLHYSTDNGKTYSDLPTLLVKEGRYSATIPMVTEPAVIKYYVSAELGIKDAGVTYDPQPEDAFSFMAGAKRLFYDDAEKNTSWDLSADTDSAWSGKWERADPTGTILYDEEVSQQDSDHTAAGRYAYITGASNEDEEPLNDAVMLGPVTLTSPAIDIESAIDPYIRYWYYYYTSTVDSNADRNSLKVYLSSDNGTNWRLIQQKTRSFGSRWLPVVVRVKDYAVPSSRMKLKFVVMNTSNNPNRYIQSPYAFSEGGVDDLEVLDLGAKSGVEPAYVRTSEDKPLTLELGEPYPNPIRTKFALPISIPEASVVKLEIKNLLGESVAIPLKEALQPGRYTVPVNLDISLPAGMYWAQLSTEKGFAYKKILLKK